MHIILQVLNYYFSGRCTRIHMYDTYAHIYSEYEIAHSMTYDTHRYAIMRLHDYEAFVRQIRKTRTLDLFMKERNCHLPDIPF